MAAQEIARFNEALDLAADSFLTPSLPEAMRDRLVMRIRRAVDTVGRLSTDLLEYTRTRLGKGIPVTRSACDLAQVCEDALEAVRGSHPGQQFTQKLSGDLRAECDVSRMQQVLVNLLHNAVQHGDTSLPVTLEAAGEPDGVVLKLHNFGRPIPPQSAEAIFQPLVQIPHPDAQPREEASASLGLGLFIVREIVRAHQGTVTVQSSADAGTVFTVKLPRRGEA